MPIEDDWFIDIQNKLIIHKSGTSIYSVHELYSWLMDVFDNSEYMRYSIPLQARSSTFFVLVNGWDIPLSSRKYLKEGNIIKKT